MSKTKKIIVISVSVAVVIAAVVLACYSSVKLSVHKGQSEKNAPAQVVDFSEKADSDTIRIMSFNIRYGSLGVLTASDRYDMVAETIRKGRPDSVGVQEATPSWMDFLEDEFADEYAYVGVGRDNGDNLGEYSAVFYLKDKYKAVDSGTFWLSETPEKPSKSWDAACNRICTWVVLENIKTGEKYVHINSHFDHVSAEARKNSVGMILEKVGEYKDLPVVFTADMNIEEGTDAYITMTAGGTMKDTKYLAEDTMSYLTYHDMLPEEHEQSILDYVMINDKFDAEVYKVVTAGIDGMYVSDHFPVYADLKFVK